METQATDLLEVLQTEILARLPLKTICRFKSVCKKWKSTIESSYFRRLFLSLHRNSSSSSSSSSSWSLMCGQDELIVFHGRKTWDDIPKSPAPLIPSSFKRFHIGDCDYIDSSGGLVLIIDGSDKAYCYVGSPVLQQWIKIPPPPSDPTGDTDVFGLMTRLDEDGVVLSFKVVRLGTYRTTNNYLSSDLSVLLYFSETGVWTSKVIHCPHQITNLFNINLNGTVYFTCLSVPGVLVSHDFYSESDQFRSVQLPDYPDYNKDYKRTLTTSGGFVMYVRTLAKKEETVLKIWMLNNDDDDDDTWHLLWEVGFSMIGNYAPMAMHPFDVATVYLWSQRDRHLVSCNLRKGDYTVLGDASNDCFIDQSVCEKSVGELWPPRSSSDLDEHLDFEVCIWLFQFVIPRWIESVPRPPQAEMIDTTSLLSHATATHERMMREHETMMRERAAIMGDQNNDEYFWMG